jgi:hypothetical protein
MMPVALIRRLVGLVRVPIGTAVMMPARGRGLLRSGRRMVRMMPATPGNRVQQHQGGG